MIPVVQSDLGRIFKLDSICLGLTHDWAGYAQAPQALVMRDRVRCFFSTRVKDSDGLFLSYPFFVDFSKDFGRILEVSKKPSCDLGELGAFDEHGIFPLSIFLDNDGTLFGFPTGWFRRPTVGADSAIGLMVSHDDGVTFSRLGRGPVISNSLDEPYLIADACVLKIKDQYHCWYVFGTNWIKGENNSSPTRIYKIGHATSADLFSWKRSGEPILESAYFDHLECQAMPSVRLIDGRFHMFYCVRNAYGFRDNPASMYRLAYAFSEDGLTWKVAPSLSPFGKGKDEWNCHMSCYPNFFEVAGTDYLLYNGNNFGESGFGLLQLGWQK